MSWSTQLALSDAYLGEVAGGKPARIPFDAFDTLQLPFLRIGNLDEIEKRVGEEEFRAPAGAATLAP